MVILSTCMYTGTVLSTCMCMTGANQGQKRALDSLEVELQMAVICQIGAGNLTWVVCKNKYLCVYGYKCTLCTHVMLGLDTWHVSSIP